MLQIHAEIVLFEKENDIQDICREAVDLAAKLHCQISFNFNDCFLVAHPVVPFDKRKEMIRLVEAYRNK